MNRAASLIPAAIGLSLLLGPGNPSPVAQTPETGEVARLSRLQGSASLGRNRGVIGATVLVHEAQEPSHVYVTATDYKGRFRVDNLPDGDYRVEIRREGLVPVVKEGVGLRFPSRAVIEVTMEPSRTAPVPATIPTTDATLDELPRVALWGVVVERGGRPMPDVRLRFVRTDGRADPIVVRSADDGSFELPAVPAGRWRLDTRVVGYLPIWVTAQLDEDVRVTLSLVPQPAAYEPSPLELMPREQPIPPERFLVGAESEELGSD